MSRESHIQATGFAGLKIEEFQQALVATLVIGEEALSAVAVAIGETSAESATNAHAWVAEVIDRVTEHVGTLENAKAEMTRYSGGF